jgi:hypothetical protein
MKRKREKRGPVCGVTDCWYMAYHDGHEVTLFELLDVAARHWVVLLFFPHV